MPFYLLLRWPCWCWKNNDIATNFDKVILDKQPQRIVLCYKNNQSAYDVFKLLDVPVEFIQGTPDDLIFDSTINNILIIDDLMSECKDNPNVSSYFTRRSHHENISVFFLSQNILMQGKCARDISLNSSYMILFNNPRDHKCFLKKH
jgi:hypothetical protein